MARSMKFRDPEKQFASKFNISDKPSLGIIIWAAIYNKRTGIMSKVFTLVCMALFSLIDLSIAVLA